VLALDVLRVLRKRDSLDAVGVELERLDAPERDCALDLASKASAEEGDAGESAARRVAFLLARSWMSGLLAEARVQIRPRGIGLPLR